MIFYHYDLDGFTHTEDDTRVFEGADFSKGYNLESLLQTSGWTPMLVYGRSAETHLTVYQHRDGVERGLYVNVRDVSSQVYTCLVMPRAWPQFYRTELLPVLQGRNTEVIAVSLLSIYTSTTALSAEIVRLTDAVKAASPGTPPVTPPGQDKTK